jgi:putative acetyltransferase
VSIADSVILRRENPDDRGVVRSINEVAFGRSDEADLIDRLRNEGAVLASFIAEWDKRIVGHILFSRILIETSSGSISAVALAPMAVLQAEQRRGVGRQLIRHGLDWLRRRGEQVVVVLGRQMPCPQTDCDHEGGVA